MRRFRQSSLTALAALALLAPAAPALASSGGSGAGLAPVGSAAAVPSTATSLGALPGDQTISFDVVLRPRNQAALDQFVRDVSTPGSAHYHQFLKTGEYAQRFGPTPQTIAAVASQLSHRWAWSSRRAGSVCACRARPRKSPPACTLVQAISLGVGASTLRANIIAAETVAPTSPYVQGVVGLDTVTQLQVTDPRQIHMASGVMAIRAPPLRRQVSARRAPATTAPNQIAIYYGLDYYWNTANFGAGTTIALFELEGFTTCDITAYNRATARARLCRTRSSSTAARCSIRCVQLGSRVDAGHRGPHRARSRRRRSRSTRASTRSSGILDIYNRIAYDNAAQVVSTSWGICESLASSFTLSAGPSPLTIAERDDVPTNGRSRTNCLRSGRMTWLRGLRQQPARARLRPCRR